MTVDTYSFIGGGVVGFICYTILEHKENRYRRAQLKALVADGRLTQTQADELLSGKPVNRTTKAS